MSQEVPDHLLDPLGLTVPVDRSDRPWGRPLLPGEFGPDETIAQDLGPRSLLRMVAQDQAAAAIAADHRCWEPCFYQLRLRDSGLIGDWTTGERREIRVRPESEEVRCRLLGGLCHVHEANLVKLSVAYFGGWGRE